MFRLSMNIPCFAVLCLSIIIACSILCFPRQSAAQRFSEIVVFGDSCSDTGNVYELSGRTTPPSPPYFDGRWSNGPVWIEYLANQLGVSAPVASLRGGANHAFAGAQTGFGETLVNGLMVPRIGTQIDQYQQGSGQFDDRTLVVLWAGINDFNPAAGGQTDASVVVNNLSTHLTTLHDAGARNFIVTNYFPEFRPAMDPFNGLWWAELDRLESELPINVFRFDFEGWIWDVIADPASFGFTNITEPALDPITGVVVPNPEEYLIWDSPSFHLTTRGHEIVADRVHSSIVPEPLTNLYVIVSAFLFATIRLRAEQQR